MPEYIEREAVIAAREGGVWFSKGRYCFFVAVDTIQKIPAADVEKRVRCEDCVSSGGDRFGELICQNQLCPCYGREVDHAFSCILGERRAEDA